MAANPNLALACQGVLPRRRYVLEFSQPNSQITGLIVGNPNLKPETGDVVTFGVVHDPQFVEGLSVSVDYWQYKIEDLITALDPNFASDQCVQTGNPTSAACSSAIRRPATTQACTRSSSSRSSTSVSWKTDGIDFGVKYALRDTAAGSFNISLDVTKINS